jgi:hypothetical protein
VHNEALSVAAMCVSNEDGSPCAIHGCNTASSPTCVAEILGDYFPLLHMRRALARRIRGSYRPVVNPADFNELSESEKRHFYKCSRCGEMVDKRQLDDVLFHETDHKPRPDIQYSRSVRIKK